MSRRSFPVTSLNRNFPLESLGRDFPLAGIEPIVVLPGTSKRLLLGELGYPFGDLWINRPDLVSTIEWKKEGGGFAAVALGIFPDLMTAARFVAFTPTDFDSDLLFDVKATDTFGNIVTKSVSVRTDIEIGADKDVLVDQTFKPFADATFADDPAEVTLVKYEASGANTVAKMDIPRETIVVGTHDGPANSSFLQDTAKDFLALGVRVGDIINNTTGGSTGTVASITTTTNPNDTLTTTLSGGTDNDFDVSDAYTITDGRSIVLIAREFELSFSNAGLTKVTLYVTDNGVPTEFSDFIQVEVSS